jgi:NDP-sugar pyrophosphorylase family protein
VREVREKPEMHLLINAGMYLIEPSARRYIPRGRRFDMTDLIQELLADGRVVVSFPIVEYWLDVGRPADYEKAQTEVRKARRA